LRGKRGTANLKRVKSVGLILALVLSIITVTIVIKGNTGQEPVNRDSRGSKGGQYQLPGEQVEGEVKQFSLELDRPMTSEEMSKLASIADTAGSLGSNSILVRAREERKGELESLPFVKNVREYLPVQKISRDIEKDPEKDTEKDRLIAVTVTLFLEKDRDSVTGLVEELGGSVTEVQGRYMRVQLPAPAITRLASSPGVMYLEEEEEPELLNDRAKDITGIRPLAIPGFVAGGGLTGKGQTLGLADSGLDTGSMSNLHPDLESEPGDKPRVIMLKSWAGVETPADTIGHGTHMAGTMVGSGQASGGKYAGLAPGASLYFQGIMDADDNLAPPLDLGELFSPAYQADVRVHVNGWGRKKNTYNSAASQIDEFIRRYPDFLPVFGAGNSGPRVGSLTAEANSKNALTVGASVSPRPAFDEALGSTSEVAGFSSRGPAEDGRIKPELLAPGTNIISTASRVVEGDLPGRPEYTSLQGTSMATAVAGSAAALLRQYFQDNTGMVEPSAALVKAALINGARQLEGTPSATGFGLLDMAGTVIALENRLFEAVEETQGIAGGESITYEFEVAHSRAPLKATLAWTDPEAVPGSQSTLVNDLNLEVITPGGERLYGNDFDQRGIPDTRNNVEQVYIPNPETGTYKIVVHGNSVLEDVTVKRGVTQDYALVFGQPPVRDIVSFSEENKAVLLGGSEISPAGSDITLAVNNSLQPVTKSLPVGAELYLTGDLNKNGKGYAVILSGRVDGIKALTVDNTTILVRINREQREGGYALDARAKDVLTLNGHPLEQGAVIPPGASVMGYVNPHSQTIWKADINSREITGVISSIDLEKGRIKMLNDMEYQLAGNASLSFSDVIVDGDPGDLPFGTSISSDLDKLVPGMPVHITLGSDGKVYHLVVKRYMVSGRVSEIEPAAGNIVLTSGGRYHVIPGIEITRDGIGVELREIKEGDLVMVNLVPDSTNVLTLSAFSDVNYGRVIYTAGDTLYLMERTEGFSMMRYHPDISVFRWGMAAGKSIISPGQWVRVIRDPVTGEVLRVDIAESPGKVQGVLESYSPGSRTIKTVDGEQYIVTTISQVTKNDIPVKPGDLMPGEPVVMTLLCGPGGDKIIASLEAETRRGVEAPGLKVKSTLPFEEISLISGITSASRLYARFPGGIFKDVEISDSGEFYYSVKASEAEIIQLVAVDGKTGGVASLQLSLPRKETGFPDIDGHWAAIDIRHLVSRGMLKGYPDGTFKPDKAVNRVEFTAMLTRLMGSNASGTELPYRDAEKIPSWARSAVALAHSRGLVGGYEDNTFRPYAGITREEVAVLLVRAYDILRGIPTGLEDNAPPYADRDNIAPWAREDVAMARELGLLGGRPDNRFVPKDHLTRAETAAALNRLLEDLTKEK